MKKFLKSQPKINIFGFLVALIIIVIVALAGILILSKLLHEKKIADFYGKQFDQKLVKEQINKFELLLSEESLTDKEDERQIKVPKDNGRFEVRGKYVNVMSGQYIKTDTVTNHIGTKIISLYTSYESNEKLIDLIQENEEAIKYIEENESPSSIKSDTEQLQNNLVELNNYLNKYSDYYNYFKSTNAVYESNPKDESDIHNRQLEIDRHKKIKAELQVITPPTELVSYHESQINYEQEWITYSEAYLVYSNKVKKLIAPCGDWGIQCQSNILKRSNLKVEAPKPDENFYEKLDYSMIYTKEDDEGMRNLIRRTNDKLILISDKL